MPDVTSAVARLGNPALTSHGIVIGGLKTTKLTAQGYASSTGGARHKRRGLTGGIPVLSGGI